MLKYLFEEFDMSSYFVRHYRQGMTWFELMQLRLDWNETTQDNRLSDWENKLGMKAIWQYKKAATPEVFLGMDSSSFDVEFFVQTVETLRSSERPFVIKPAHLCGSEAVYLSDGKTFAPATVFSPLGLNEKGSEKRPGLTYIIQEVKNSLQRQVDAREAWSLRNGIAGALIEAFVVFDADIRVMTLFGKVQGAAVAGFDVFINNKGKLFGEDAEEFKWFVPFWNELVYWSERVAEATDMLRLDFFVSKKGNICLNEMCTFVWPEASTFDPFLGEFARVFVEGYMQCRIVTQERDFARLHT